MTTQYYTFTTASFLAANKTPHTVKTNTEEHR